MLSFIAQPVMGALGALSFESGHASGLQTRVSRSPRMWAPRTVAKAVAARNNKHAVLVDTYGAWAWDPCDSHAGATRYASVSHWIETHAGCEMSLWVSGPLIHSVKQTPDGVGHQDEAAIRGSARRQLVEHHGSAASDWPLATWHNTFAQGVCALAGVDLNAVKQHAARFDVKIFSVEPWWHHAFETAKRCATTLNESSPSRVCVVEGAQVAWISCLNGLLVDVQQSKLASPTVEALEFQLNELVASQGSGSAKTVVLGQGLRGGARTRALGALVLGRLDGDQPPQWLRPGANEESH